MSEKRNRVDDILEKDVEDIENIPKEGEPAEDEIEVLSSFDLEKLVVEGKDAVLIRNIEFFDLEDGKKKKMPVYLKPLSRGDRGAIDRAIAKKDNNKNLIDLICALGMCMDEKGKPIDISVIREMEDGFVKSVADEIKFISGEFTDRWEDKAIQQVFGKN